MFIKESVRQRHCMSVHQCVLPSACMSARMPLRMAVESKENPPVMTIWSFTGRILFPAWAYFFFLNTHMDVGTAFSYSPRSIVASTIFALDRSSQALSPFPPSMFSFFVIVVTRPTSCFVEFWIGKRLFNSLFPSDVALRFCVSEKLYTWQRIKSSNM